MQSSSKYEKLSVICLDHLTWNMIRKIYKNKKIVHLTTPFNQLHGCQAIRSTYHTTLQATPFQLVFGRDVIHNINFRANRVEIVQRA
jgi:hypothetical protein